MQRYVHVTGWGAHVPRTVVTNDDVCRRVESSDAWIRARTGIVTRHIAADDESTATLAVGAARQALAAAGLMARDVDLIFCATNTFDVLVPNLACTVQRQLGFTLGSDGARGDLIVLPIGLRHSGAIEGDARRPPHLQMSGNEVFRFAVRIVGDVVRTLASDAGLALSDIDLVISHQANLRIIEAAAKRIDLPPERIYARVHAYGNTSTASIPLALADAVRTGVVRAGHRIALVGFGGGLSWGGCLIEWTAPTVPLTVNSIEGVVTC